MKKYGILVLIFTVMVLLVGCSNGESNDIEDPITDSPDSDEYIYLTLVELSEFDGKEGRDAYIAVDGNIYDVTDSSLWPNGNHNGYEAGQDLTEEILNVSPHGLSTLDGVPLIGEIVE